MHRRYTSLASTGTKRPAVFYALFIYPNYASRNDHPNSLTDNDWGCKNYCG